MPECSCDTCVRACKNRVCWGTPRQIERLIKRGYGSSLMLDRWVENKALPLTFILCPAAVGFEAAHAPVQIQRRQCTLLTVTNRCLVHKFKPGEGSLAMHDTPQKVGSRRHLYYARSWNTERGKALVARWCEEHGVDPNELPEVSVFDLLTHALGL